MTNPSKSESEHPVKRLLAEAIWATVERDPQLFEYKLNEVAAVAPIYARMHSIGIDGYDIDFEYDRVGRAGDAYKHHDAAQVAVERKGSIRPDILVHKRGRPEFNLLVVEIKLAVDSRADREKVRQTMEAKRYRFGATVVLRHKSDQLPRWRWFDSRADTPGLEVVPYSRGS
jgi:hypothetical protein